MTGKSEAQKKDAAERLQKAVILNALTMPVAAYFLFYYAAPDVLADFGIPVFFEGISNLIFVGLTALIGAVPVIRATREMNEKR